MPDGPSGGAASYAGDSIGVNEPRHGVHAVVGIPAVELGVFGARWTAKAVP